MNLNALSLEDLRDLEKALAMVGKCAAMLRHLPGVEEAPVIRALPGQPLVIVTGFVMPSAVWLSSLDEPVLIEPIAPDAVQPEPVAPEPVDDWFGAVDDVAGRAARLAVVADAARARVFEDAESGAGPLPVAGVEAARLASADESSAPSGWGGDGGGLDEVSVPVRPAAPEEAQEEAGRADAVPVAPVPAGDGPSAARVFVTGPLSDAEKNVIKAAAALGVQPASIALRLNRRVQTVSLYLDRMRRDNVPLPSAGQMSVGPVAVPPDTGQATAAAQVPACAATSFRSARQRQIGVHVDCLRKRAGFDAELDLDLAEAISRGERIPAIATDLGLDSAAVSARWKDLAGPLLGDRGLMSIDDQRFLVVELRRKAMEARRGAA